VHVSIAAMCLGHACRSSRENGQILTSCKLGTPKIFISQFDVHAYIVGIYSVSQKPPMLFSGIFSQMVGNFIKFYTPIIRSYLR